MFADLSTAYHSRIDFLNYLQTLNFYNRFFSVAQNLLKKQLGKMPCNLKFRLRKT